MLYDCHLSRRSSLFAEAFYQLKCYVVSENSEDITEEILLTLGSILNQTDKTLTQGSYGLFSKEFYFQTSL